MITTKELARIIQERLNGELVNGEYANITKYGLDKFHANLRYEFCVEANNAEYKKAERRGAVVSSTPTNMITQYIMGVLQPTSGAEIEGNSADTYNTTVSAMIDLLIPDCDDMTDINGYTLRFQDAVSALIAGELGAPSNEYITGEDGIVYYVATRYTRAVPGTKDFRAQVGLSLSLMLDVSFSIIATGISSRDITLSIDGEDVYFTTLGIARRSVQENNVNAYASAPTAEYGTSKTRTTASQLFLSFDAPTRPTAINERMAEYLLTGEITPLSVTLGIPTKRDERGKLITRSKTFSMVFTEAGLNAQLNLAASSAIKLTEELEGEDG